MPSSSTENGSRARDVASSSTPSPKRLLKADRPFAVASIGSIVVFGAILAAVALLLNTVLDDGVFERGSLALRTKTETSYITATVTKTQVIPQLAETTTSTKSFSAWSSLATPIQNDTKSFHANATDDSEESGDDDEEEDVDGPDWLENFEISWGQLENYELGNKLGEGEYAEVFQAIDVRNNKTCVVKVLKPTEKHLVKLEIKILQDLVGGPNIVRLIDVARNSLGKSPSIVTEYVNNEYYRRLYSSFDDMEVRFYMFQLLSAVDYAHSNGIMHRDIKPHNVMIDHESKKLRLIDWGLSSYYDPDDSYSTSVGSRFWRAPELLVKYEWYNPSSDIWAVGCMMAGLIFGKEPFFRGRHNDVNQLVKIAQILGTEDLFKWLDKYEIELGKDFDDIKGLHPKQTWESQVYWQKRRRFDDDAFDLLSKILVYDHNGRFTASEAMDHRYFDPVRSWALTHPNTTTTWDTE